MAKEDNGSKEEGKAITANSPMVYEHIIVEFWFTDGERVRNEFDSWADCLGDIERKVRERYIDSVRIELF